MNPNANVSVNMLFLFLSKIKKKKSFYVYEFLWKGIPEASFIVIFRRKRRVGMSEDRREKKGER